MQQLVKIRSIVKATHDVFSAISYTILSDKESEGYAQGRMSEDFIETHSGGTDKLFYLSGPPPPMIEATSRSSNYLLRLI